MLQSQSQTVSSPSKVSAFGLRLQKGLASRYVGLVMAGLAIIFTLPTVGQPWLADDLLHRAMLLSASLPALLKGMFVFVQPDQSYQLMNLSLEQGTLPWWTAPDLKIAFFRPLAVLSHWLDYQLWPETMIPMRLHSILWYASCCFLTTLLYRRLIQPLWVAGLAALLFSIDILHLGAVVWLANRNALMALFFGLLSLLSHHQWRQSRRRIYLAGAVIWLALSLLSAEAGIAIGAYLLAYALFLESGFWLKRLVSLIPYGFTVIIWRLGYQAMGYGTENSGFYLDPLGQGPTFIASALERGPVLLVSQWLGVLPAPYNLLSMEAAQGVWLISILGLIVIAIFIAPLIIRDKTAQFWAVGMFLALIPACAIRLLSGRVLLFVSLGAIALMARFIGGLVSNAPWLPHQQLWRATGRGFAIMLVILHLLLPFILWPGAIIVPRSFQTTIRQVTDIGPFLEGKNEDVVILNAPSPFHFIYLPAMVEKMPPHLRLLAPGYGTVIVARVDERTLRISPEAGYSPPPGTWAGNETPILHNVYMYQHLATFFREPGLSIAPDREINLAGLHIEAAALTPEGQPAEITARFDRPLDQMPTAWLQWNWTTARYEPFMLPAVGETVVITGPG